MRDKFGFDGVIHGVGQRSGTSDHPSGNAIDVMVNNNKALGDSIAEFYRQNRVQLGITYVIWWQKKASASTGYQWKQMEDRGSKTANHYDHPHISFKGGALSSG